MVAKFVESNLMVFPGRCNDAESTCMPASRAWIRNSLEELEGCNSPEDHSIMLWLNAPTMGIMSAAKESFMLTYLTNVLRDYPKNSICIILFPNRGSQK